MSRDLRNFYLVLGYGMFTCIFLALLPYMVRYASPLVNGLESILWSLVDTYFTYFSSIVSGG